MEQKLVVHRKDGAVFKGVTQDFDPENEAFHFLPAEGGGIPIRMVVDEMKALFWVRDYLGNRAFVAERAFDEADRESQRAIVTFVDGEEIWGTLEADPGETDPEETAVNGLGNLIVGYNESSMCRGLGRSYRIDQRTGSHNLIVGSGHNFPSFGGFCCGFANTVSGAYAFN